MSNRIKWTLVMLGVWLAAYVVGYAAKSASAPGVPDPGQDVMSVDRRVTTLEQRIYTMDSHINQLQQQLMMISRIPATPSAGASGDAAQLRVELDLLRNQLIQVECAIAKLDERTLAPGKSKRTGPKDPCRLDPQTPTELPGHPY